MKALKLYTFQIDIDIDIDQLDHYTLFIDKPIKIGNLVMNEMTKKTIKNNPAQTSKRILQMMCQKFKGTDLDIDQRIDAAAPFIIDNALATFIPGLRPGEPTVPPYLEGEAGVGKTAIVEQASRDFCKITELNFVKNPPVDYIPTKQDFYFFDTSLAGETSHNKLQDVPLAKVSAAKFCLVFFDDLDTASRPLRAVVMKLAREASAYGVLDLGLHSFVVMGSNPIINSEQVTRTVSETTSVELIRISQDKK